MNESKELSSVLILILMNIYKKTIHTNKILTSRIIL